MTEEAQVRSVRWTLVPVLATVFLDSAGVGLIIPVLPFIGERFGANAIEIGIFFTLFAACQFLTAPILGTLSDTYGRRPILLWCLGGAVISYAMMGWASSLAILYVSRAVAGLTAGNISAAQACIADLTPAEKRTSAFGLFGAVYTAGWLLGPAAGGLLSVVDLRAPAFAACGVTALNMLAAAIFVRETLPARHEARKMDLRKLNPALVLGRILANERLRIPIVATFMLGCVFATFQSNFPVFVGDRFGLGPTDVAKFFVMISIIGVISQAYLLRLLSERCSDAAILAIGVCVIAGAYVAIAFSPAVIFLWIAVPLSVLGNALWRPSMLALMSKRVSVDEQGMIIGASHSAMSLGLIVGPMWAGIAYAKYGQPSPYWTMSLLAVLALALLALDASVKEPENNRAR